MNIYLSIYFSVLAGGLFGICYWLYKKVNALEDTLDTVRMATYELTSMLDDEVRDIQESLKDAKIPASRTHIDERMRRLALTPEARHAESLARWEAVVAQYADRKKTGI